MLGKGVLGGDPSPQCRTYLQRNGELIRIKPHRMADFKTGDTLIKLSAGGAGVGSARERDVSAVVRDVGNGLVTLEAARLIYGVAIDPRTLKVDEAETTRLRSQVPYPENEIVVNSEKLGVEIRPVRDPGIRRG
jgi:N-methylhydantoinase B